ncbi:aldo/keto reductase [Fulvivirgaceae bacterium PWU5]|uniref:Aldo/keto reductase n=1 Tax=Dawidia cretensis TaxID=2782350 RepID=A0AAP2DXW6_9BACT|nr:aldo/keto reductase [Dawidia cretensis]MBT1709403.1 aldo/keto reductase [Dawidia cretensis]
MTTRRTFLSMSLKGTAVASLMPILPALAEDAAAVPQSATSRSTADKFKPSLRYGLGGVAIGNAFRPTTEIQAQQTLEGAWDAGVRYFDTSPWYGLGLSERRFGHFLHTKKRDEYVLSTKIGRILTGSKDVPKTMWIEPSPFKYAYDYSAAGTRRSIEDSLQRLGIESIDIVYIHDLSPDNEDMKDKWTEYFKTAQNGAMKELTKMREEGLIKAWGLGVNTIDPILKTLEVADPDIFLSATQYSLISHEDAVNRLFPAVEKKGVSLVMGAPLNSGFLAGIDRYNYKSEIPPGFREKRERLSKLAEQHGTDLRTAALQFAAAPSVVAAVIPGTRSAIQARENVESMKVKIPAEFWAALKKEKLIVASAPVPK